MSNNIGEKIKAKRIELGYSQDYLAKLLGYKSRSTIAKIESGENDITQTKIYEFAHALNCSPSDLLDIHEFTEPDRIALREAFGPAGVMLVKKNPTDEDNKFLNKVNELAKLEPNNRAKIYELISLYLESQNKSE